MHRVEAGRSRQAPSRNPPSRCRSYCNADGGDTGQSPPTPAMFEGVGHTRARSDRRPSRTQTALPRPRHRGGGVDGGDSGPADPSRIVTWRVTQPGMLRSLLGTTAVRGRSAEPTLVAGGLAENLFDFEPADLARLPQLVEAALARAPAGAGCGRPDGVAPATAGPAHRGAGPPRWKIRIKGKGERARPTPFVGEDRLGPSARDIAFQHLDLRAGGPDLDELLKQIGAAIKDRWGIRYVEVERKDRSEFEASVASAPGTQPVTRFTAGFDGIHTTTFDVPGSAFPAASRQRFQHLGLDCRACPSCRNALATAWHSRRKDRLVVMLKPKREFGDNRIEWRLGVQDQRHRHLDPDRPPVRRIAAVSDARGELLRTVFPPGRGPEGRSARSPCARQGPGRHIARIGPDLKAAELKVSADEIALTAVDRRTRIRSRSSRTAISRSSGNRRQS